MNFRPQPGKGHSNADVVSESWKSWQSIAGLTLFTGVGIVMYGEATGTIESFAACRAHMPSVILAIYRMVLERYGMRRRGDERRVRREEWR